MTPAILTHADRLARRRLIAEFVRDGATIEKAAQHYRVSLQTVYHSCREHNVLPGGPGSGRKRGPITFAILARLLNSDDSYTAIAAQFQVYRQWVGHIAKQAREAGIRCRSGESA